MRVMHFTLHHCWRESNKTLPGRLMIIKRENRDRMVEVTSTLTKKFVGKGNRHSTRERESERERERERER